MNWLICFLIAIVPAAYVYYKDRKKNIPVKWLPALLRFFVFFTVAILLFAPPLVNNTTEEEAPLIVILQDESQSMQNALGKDSAKYQSILQNIIKDLQGEYEVAQIGFGTNITKDSLFRYEQASTNITNALQSVADQYSGRNIGAIVMLSDGVYNEGAAPSSALSLSNIPIYTVGIGDSTMPKDIWINRVYANKIVNLDAKFEVMADINAIKLMGNNAKVTLMHKEKIVQSKNITMDKNDFSTSITFEAKATSKGLQHYSVVVSPVDEEQNLHNNRYDFYVEVTEESIEVLLWAAAVHPDINAIREALDNFPQYKLNIHTGSNAPADLQKYNLLIAHQIPDKLNNNIHIIPEQMPTWFILGERSNIPVFNRIQNIVDINGGNAHNDALPLLQPTFNLFHLPENLQVILDKAPPLRAPFGNYTIKGNAQVLMYQKIGNVITQYPLWLLTNDNTPLAFTMGDGLWRWGFYEYKNNKNKNTTHELIRQTIALLSVKKDNRPFRIFLDKYILSENEPVQVFATLKNAAGEIINTPEATLNLIDSNGNNQKFTFDKTGNSYRINLGLLSQGNYTIQAATQLSGKSYSTTAEFIVQAEPLELLRSHSDYALLSNIAQQSQGKFYTLDNAKQISTIIQSNENIKPVLHTVKSVEHFIDKKWLFLLIFLLAVGEWLLRKYWSLN